VVLVVLLLVVPSKTAKLNVGTRPMPTPGPGGPAVGRVVAARGPRDDDAAAAKAPVSWQVATKWPHRENNARSWREAPASPLEDG
jgi:hypothetical protein